MDPHRQALAIMGMGTHRSLLQVTVILGASQDVIPQLKKKHGVDTLDMVFLDHWKDRYLPDLLLLEVSPVLPDRVSCSLQAQRYAARCPLGRGR